MKRPRLTQRSPMLRKLMPIDRKSTRLNSSHLVISYAVFCLKKKKQHASADWNSLTLLVHATLAYDETMLDVVAVTGEHDSPLPFNRALHRVDDADALA